MGYKKLLKFLCFAILLSSLPINSYASSEIPDRYQTVEGEYITIEDSTEGELHEIEIFGNTVQDPDNLEDIQSVGDLYIDDEGNPVLDEQGREQYKVDIESCNDNIYTGDSSMELGAWSTTGGSVVTTSEIRCKNNYVPLPKGIKNGDIIYLILTDKTINSNTNMHIYDSNKKYQTTINSYFSKGVAKIQITDISKIAYFSFRAISTNIDCKWGIFTKTQDYIPHKSSRTTILLPCQLMKVGDVADRLYWDSEKDRYIIEKSINIKTLKSSDNWKMINDGLENYLRFYLQYGEYNSIKPLVNNSIYIISNTLPSVKYNLLFKKEIEGITISTTGATSFQVLKSKASNLDEFKTYIDNSIIYYITDTTQLIETSIVEKIKLPTYEGKTHIFVNTENGINPTLKVTVDRIGTIADDTVESFEAEPTIENLSLARYIVNQMPESLLKDQLQLRLNNVFAINDLELEKKSITNSADVYIKLKNVLSLSLDTNMITFDDFDGVEDMEKANAVKLMVDSSLPYEINAYLPNEIQNFDKSNILDKNILKIKSNSESEYKVFSETNTKLQLLDVQSSGYDVSHYIDIMLDGGLAYKTDVYKAVIKFEVEQK